MRDFGKKIEKAIRYCDRTDTYYVQFSYADRTESKLRSFPTLEEARTYRDAIYKAKFDVKLNEDLAKIYTTDRSAVLSKKGVFPANAIDDMNLSVVDEKFYDEDFFLSFVDEHLIRGCGRCKICFLGMYKEFKTLEQIGKEINLTRERVRQIICKSLLILKSGIVCYAQNEKQKAELELKNKELEDLKKQRQELIEAYKVNNDLENAEIEAFFGKPTIYTSLNEFSYLGTDLRIETLDLSVRSYNCLKRAGIQTISELCALNKEDLIKYKNMGVKSVKEIVEKMHERSYMFKDE